MISSDSKVYQGEPYERGVGDLYNRYGIVGYIWVDIHHKIILAGPIIPV